MNRQQERFVAFKMFKETRREIAEIVLRLDRVDRYITEALLLLERADHPLGSTIVRPKDPDSGVYPRYSDQDIPLIEQQLRELS